MPDCNTELIDFPSFDRRKIEASFSGGDVSSDGGVMVLRQADRRLGLCRALDAALADPRDPDLITHAQVDLLRQRIYGLALGYEDLNDHDTLRKDLAWQSAEAAEGNREAGGRASWSSAGRNWPAARPCAGWKIAPTARARGRSRASSSSSSSRASRPCPPN